MEKYKVQGSFEGKKINQVVEAGNKKHAKLRAGFKSGIYGNNTRNYMKRGKVSVKKV